MELQIFLVIIAVTGVSLADNDKLAFSLNQDGSYSFAAGGNHAFNLTSGDAFLQSNKMPYSAEDGTLKLQSQTALKGEDAMGEYEGKSYTYSAGAVAVHYQVLVYQGGQFARFRQVFPEGVRNSNMSNHDDVVSAFPNFRTDRGTKDIGYMNMFDNMCGYSYLIGNFSSAKFLRGGQRAGPLVAFDSKGNVMILSAFSNFMAHNMYFNFTTLQMNFGIMGGVTDIPVNYEIDTILYFGSNGINRAIEGWGHVLTKRFGKTPEVRDNDFTIRYLGYWTDNGAFYYYQKEQNKTYEDTVLDVVKYASSAGIPYRYLQYDSWWYYKGIGDGVKNWTGMNDVFPHGMEYLFQQHGLPVAAHNRYWSSNTDYAKQNGGKYNFVVETSKAIPTDDKFWDDLLHNSTAWGLIMYEQDWLDREFELMTATHTNINLGRNWLLQMGHGASERGMTVQYCMALSRHMLQSVEIPSVTQARVSGDYQPGNDQWKIGVTSMFANALHLAPFKDTFWTTSHQNGSEYNNDEKYPALQAAVATLSTGPVGPSDSIGMTSNIIHRSCRSDGLLLKPSRPITTLDVHIVNKALPSLLTPGTHMLVRMAKTWNRIFMRPKKYADAIQLITCQYGRCSSANLEAEVFTTYSDISYTTHIGRHGVMLVTDLTAAFEAAPEMMYMDPQGTYVAYNGYPGNDLNVYEIAAMKSHPIPKCGRSDFQLWYFSPIITVGGRRLAVLGERGKWVPLSTQRTKSVEVTSISIVVHAEGVPGESIQFGFYDPSDEYDNKVAYVNCGFGNSGKIRLTYPSTSQSCIQE